MTAVAEGQAEAHAQARAERILDIEQLVGGQVAAHHAAGLADDDVAVAPAVALHGRQQRGEGRPVGAFGAQCLGTGHLSFGRAPGRHEASRIQGAQGLGDLRLAQLALLGHGAILPAQHGQIDPGAL